MTSVRPLKHRGLDGLAPGLEVGARVVVISR
jgi:hypothetical protein